MNVFKYLDNQDKADIILFLQYFYFNLVNKKCRIKFIST